MKSVDDYLFEQNIRIRKTSTEDLMAKYEKLHTFVYETPYASWTDLWLLGLVDNELLRRGIDTSA